ncbi:hypothetical protein [Planococcus rifietoensis]|uniref:hypothetical protein n=1 Tax=Planococcus rifietoensis TaxID=200991 RepID=UPI003850E785
MDWVITVLTSGVVAALINFAWKYVENQKQFANTKYLQISNFYRDSSGNDMHNILREWTDILMSFDDPEVNKKMSDPSYLSNLLKRTYLYSSPETVRRLARYQSYNYRTNEYTDHHEMLVLVTGIIVSLRRDFTGDWVSIEETLKLKLNDYPKNESKFRDLIDTLEYDKK